MYLISFALDCWNSISNSCISSHFIGKVATQYTYICIYEVESIQNLIKYKSNLDTSERNKKNALEFYL